MSTTLTNGLKLPDKGSVDWYADMQSNYAILDGAVGTIAEHTSALAGKAPLVHTHTKSDITDFPALATVATSGSYNDLSNIPASFTPASHSHGSITNDGKVGTTANKPLITGTDGVVQAGSFGTSANTFCEGNDSRLSDARTPVAHTHGKADITDLFNSANTWTGNNYFPRIGVYQRGFSSRASTPASNEFSQYSMADANNSPLMSINSANRTTGVRDLTFRVYTNDGSVNGVGVFKAANDNYSFCSLDPNNTIELGTSINKWKTLNGINPGALSFPTTDTSKLAYFSSDITDLTGGLNTKTFALDGWVTIFMPNVSGDFIAIDTSIGQVISVSGTGVGDANIACICPVRAGITNRIYCKCSSSLTAAFIPCAGSV